MLQRIQTLYLLIVVIALALMFFFPVAQVNIPEGKIYEFFIYGISANGAGAKALSINWTSVAIVSILILNSLITIFMFKKRLIQVRLTILNIFMMLGSIFLLWYNISNQAETVEADVRYLMPMIIPIICIVLSYLAIRAIGKDESLIRSMDRIR